MKTVYIDLDGVLFDFQKSLKDYLSKKGICYNPDGCKTYGFDGDIGCSKSDVFSCFKDLEFYKSLLLFDKVDGCIERLKLNGYRALAYTTVGDNVYDIRKLQIKSLGLDGDPYVGDKPVLGDADAVFEDCIETLERWFLSGSKAKLYLIDAPYNQKTKDNEASPVWDSIIRCKNFEEAVDNYLGL